LPDAEFESTRALTLNSQQFGTIWPATLSAKPVEDITMLKTHAGVFRPAQSVCGGFLRVGIRERTA